MSLLVRAITTEQHDAWIATRPYVSFLQLPQWGRVKADWRSESLGWFDGSQLVGAGLALYRGIPRLPRRSLAYIPEGPDLNWSDGLDVADWLPPLLEHCRHRGAFLVKVGPPVIHRQWESTTIKSAIASRESGTGPSRLSAVAADRVSAPADRLMDQLRSAGGHPAGAGATGFADGQPRFVFQLPIQDRTEEQLFTGLNQLWRRNIRRAQAAGVTVRRGDAQDLPDFHRVYVETAQRDGFTPRALSYFTRLWDALEQAPHAEPALFIAERDGHLAAATLLIKVGCRSWYSYGASTTADRDARPSNAVQWAMIEFARDAGCDIYDLRGIVDTVDPHDPLFGLVQFKVGTGGHAVEYVGEWDFVLRPSWARAYGGYQRMRSNRHG